MHANDTLDGSKAAALQHLLRRPQLSRAIGGGDALTGLLAARHGFDAIWASGLCISASHGLPDASFVTMTEFLQAARIIDRSTLLPVLADCDTGFGDPNIVGHMVREYGRAGIAGVCIEDKRFPKRNSFSEGQELESVDEFCSKLRAARQARVGDGPVIMARIESLIAGMSIEEAIDRAGAYESAGAEALLIHSKAKEPDEVFEFCRLWAKVGGRLPVAAVPTTYYQVTIENLEEAGLAMVIYANHSLRAAVRAIDDVLHAINLAGSSAAVEDQITTVADVLTMIGM